MQMKKIYLFNGNACISIVWGSGHASPGTDIAPQIRKLIHNCANRRAIRGHIVNHAVQCHADLQEEWIELVIKTSQTINIEWRRMYQRVNKSALIAMTTQMQLQLHKCKVDILADSCHNRHAMCMMLQAVAFEWCKDTSK